FAGGHSTDRQTAAYQTQRCAEEATARVFPGECLRQGARVARSVAETTRRSRQEARADRESHPGDAGIQGARDAETRVHPQARRIRSARRAGWSRDAEVPAGSAGKG